MNITKGFWMGQTEVTVGAYKGFITCDRKANATWTDITWGGRSIRVG